MIDVNASEFVRSFVINRLEWFPCLFAEVAGFTGNTLMIWNVFGYTVGGCMEESLVPKGIFVDGLVAGSVGLSCLGCARRSDIRGGGCCCCISVCINRDG